MSVHDNWIYLKGIFGFYLNFEGFFNYYSCIYTEPEFVLHRN